MDDRTLSAVIEQEIATSIGSHTGDLADERALELDYYNSELFGNEREGESVVVSSDVFDTVEGMLPSLLRIFTASDEVVVFEPYGIEDEAKAKQRTEVCNYIFYKQNNGFLVLYEWFKDALINKNGVVKYWWDKNISTVKESYEGLSEGQYLKFLHDPSVEITAVTEREDEDEQQRRADALAKIMSEVDRRSKGLPPEAIEQLKAQLTQQSEAQPVAKVYDVEIRVKKDKSRVCVEVVPPEEFFISARTRCVSIQQTDFCAHQRKMAISELREAGCPEEILTKIGSTGERDTGPESIARDRFTDEWRDRSAVAMSEPSRTEATVADTYIRVDYDGDGISELRHVIKVEGEIWINEECDHICFAALTPIIMPHRWLGKSAAELVMHDQFTKSTIWRQMLNNLYLTNNPRKKVQSTAGGIVHANLDDLMSSRIGGIIREYMPGAVTNEEVPFVAGQSFPMLEYIDQQKEVRTGQTRYSQGTDSDSLNKTASGIHLIQQAGQQRGDLIARIFAETGVKDLMRGIAYVASKYSTKAMTLKLTNEWVEVDPREWKEEYDMTVNVGLGTGNKDVQLAHLERMGARQVELLANGKGYMVTDQNLYELDKKRAEAMGFKHPQLFISDPKTVQKPPDMPPPEIVKIQTDAQTDQAKIQSNEKMRQFDAMTQKALKEMDGKIQVITTQMNNDAKERIEKMNIAAQAQNTLFTANKEAGMKQLDHQHENVMVEKTNKDTLAKDTESGVQAKSSELVSQINEHQAQTVMAVGEIGGQLVSVISQFGQMLGGIQQSLSAQNQLLAQQLEQSKKPKVTKIGDVTMKDGVITSATTMSHAVN